MHKRACYAMLVLHTLTLLLCITPVFLLVQLTQNIRQVYFTDKTRTVKLHLNNKVRLDITLTVMEDGQMLCEQLTRIKTRRK
jgi:hypothetical protein